MTNVYNDADFLAVFYQKRRLLAIFFAITGVYAGIGIAMLIYFTSLPYASPNATWPKMVMYVLSVLYVLFIYPFLGIKYKRVNRYQKVLSYINDGIKSEERNYFYAYRRATQQQDNVDAIVGVFAAWNKKRQEWQEREVYFDVEKPLPDFQNGDLVRYISQSNFIVQYEILQRGAYNFEEVDEFKALSNYMKKLAPNGGNDEDILQGENNE